MAEPGGFLRRTAERFAASPRFVDGLSGFLGHNFEREQRSRGLQTEPARRIPRPTTLELPVIPYTGRSLFPGQAITKAQELHSDSEHPKSYTLMSSDFHIGRDRHQLPTSDFGMSERNAALLRKFQGNGWAVTCSPTSQSELSTIIIPTFLESFARC